MLSNLGDLSYMFDSFLSVHIYVNLAIILKTKQISTQSLPKQISNNIQIITSLQIDTLSATTDYRALAV